MKYSEDQRREIFRLAKIPYRKPTRTLSVDREFEDLRDARDRQVAAFQRGILDLVKAIRNPLRDAHQIVRATRSLGNVIAAGKQWSNIMGRRRMILEASADMRRAGVERPIGFATAAENLARVEFTEATADIVNRNPALKPGFKAVQEFYSEEHGFALAKSGEIAVTEKVQEVLSQALRQGLSLPTGADLVRDLGDWSRAYAEQVFRTNLSSAYTAGRMQQAFEPELDDFIIGFRRAPVGDADTRSNHNFTIVAGKRDPIWLKLGVPGGYNCRCVLQQVTALDDVVIPARADAPAGFFNDPGFQNRVGFEVFGILP